MTICMNYEEHARRRIIDEVMSYLISPTSNTKNSLLQ
jgi:hypothetical protein